MNGETTPDFPALTCGKITFSQGGLLSVDNAKVTRCYETFVQAKECASRIGVQLAVSDIGVVEVWDGGGNLLVRVAPNSIEIPKESNIDQRRIARIQPETIR